MMGVMSFSKMVFYDAFGARKNGKIDGIAGFSTTETMAIHF
jgi:hypothetical protein